MSKKTKVQLFVQGSIFLVISNICIKAINFFLLPLYTKNLTPSMLGVSDSITTMTGILFPLLVMGLDSSYSAFYFDDNEANRDKIVFSTIGFTFILIGIIPIILCFFAKTISNVLFNNDNYSTVIIIAFCGVTLNLWALPFSLELRLKNKMGRFGFVSIVTSLFMVLLNVIFVSWMKLGEVSLILSTTIVAALHVVLYLFFVKKLPSKNYFDFSLLKKMTVFAIPLVPTVLMAWILSLSDRYIVLFYHGETYVGLYGIGARFVTVLNVFINAITTAYTTFAFGSKDDTDAKKHYYQIFNVLSLILLFIAFTIALFSREIISIMTNEAYYSSHIIIRDMLYSQVVYAMTTIVSYGYIFKKKSVYSLVSVSTGAIVNLVLNFLLIPRYGITGAAFTTLIGYLVSFVLSYYFSEKSYPCSYGLLRVAITVLTTYIIALLFSNVEIIIRIILWIIIVAGCFIAYRDIIKSLVLFAIQLINKD